MPTFTVQFLRFDGDDPVILDSCFTTVDRLSDAVSKAEARLATMRLAVKPADGFDIADASGKIIHRSWRR
jgi:hypothetical protein